MSTVPPEVVRCLLAAGEKNLLSQAIAGECRWTIEDPPKGLLDALQVEASDTVKPVVVTLTLEEPVPITMRFLLLDGCPERMAREMGDERLLWENVEGFWMESPESWPRTA